MLAGSGVLGIGPLVKAETTSDPSACQLSGVYSYFHIFIFQSQNSCQVPTANGPSVIAEGSRRCHHPRIQGSGFVLAVVCAILLRELARYASSSSGRLQSRARRSRRQSPLPCEELDLHVWVCPAFLMEIADQCKIFGCKNL
jgi:hypothetical protein